MNRQKLNLALYKKIFLIRAAEDAIIKEYDQNQMKTPMHMSRGEESIMAGVCLALGAKNPVLGTYRSHGLYLAKTEETYKFFGEMYGKATGILKGKGGSMHLLSPEHGLLGVSAIVSSTIPVALGVAYANKLSKTGKVAAVFFGDGAIDEGAFWESLNFACLKKLPLIFIFEDNGFAVHTSGQERHGYRSIGRIVSQFNCQLLEADSTDPEIIYNITKKAIQLVQKGRWPIFLSLKYYRYLEHVGIYEDFNSGYRSKSEFTRWSKKNDPLVNQRLKLQKIHIPEKAILSLEKKILYQVSKDLQNAKDAPFPDKAELFKHVYYEN